MDLRLSGFSVTLCWLNTRPVDLFLRTNITGGSVVKNLPATQETQRDLDLIPGLGRSSGEGNGNPLQDCCLENPMDRGAWSATVHGVEKSRTQLSDFASLHWTTGGEGDDRGRDGWMASPTWWTWVWATSGSWWWRRKPGVLQSMGSQRVGHDWVSELTQPQPPNQQLVKRCSMN